MIWQRTMRAGMAWRWRLKKAIRRRGRRLRRSRSQWTGSTSGSGTWGHAVDQAQARVVTARQEADSEVKRDAAAKARAISARLAARGAALDAALDQVRQGYADFQADLRDLAILGRAGAVRKSDRSEFAAHARRGARRPSLENEASPAIAAPQLRRVVPRLGEAERALGGGDPRRRAGGKSGERAA